MEKQNPYTPISCNFYDELEARATLRRPCTIRYKEGEEEQILTDVVIVDFFIREGAEYLRLQNGTTIRLDRLISVDGKVLQK